MRAKGLLSLTGVAAPGATRMTTASAAAVVLLVAAVTTGQVQPTVETEPVPSRGDAADDAAIWVHPHDPTLHRIIGTDKNSGLAVYDLTGREVQFLPIGEPNNVDVRYNFPLDGELVDLVCTGNRADNTVDVYRVNPSTGLLVDVTAGPIAPAVEETYGFCMYRSSVTSRFYFFVNDQNGHVEQWELFDNGQGLVDAIFMRSFEVGSQTEGMVADDARRLLYIGEEQVGIWRFGAEPQAGEQGTLVDVTGPGGHLTADVEGLAIYHAAGGGYLLASSQGSSEFVVYDRRGDNAWIKTFVVAAAPSIDAVSGTDGIDVTSVAAGPAFPDGFFVAQDTDNLPQHQNFKLVPWNSVAFTGAVPLVIDTSWDPRAPIGDINGDGSVGTLDFLAVLASWGPCEVPCPADIDIDGAVGTTDLLLVLTNWSL